MMRTIESYRHESWSFTMSMTNAVHCSRFWTPTSKLSWPGTWPTMQPVVTLEVFDTRKPLRTGDTARGAAPHPGIFGQRNQPPAEIKRPPSFRQTAHFFDGHRRPRLY